MSNSGKLLEIFVEQIEKILLPENINLKTNDKVYNDDGIQIAEFDIEVEGKIGTTDLKWLIECRDRPSEGPAPGSWIEQLVGRRDRFGFNKVIAVSTTGFSTGAEEYAEEAGIEIRTVTPTDLEQNRDWLLSQTIKIFTKGGRLDEALLLLSDDEPEEVKSDIKEIFKKLDFKSPILQSTETKKYLNILEVFHLAINSIDSIYDELFSDKNSKEVKLRMQYPYDDSHYVIDSKFGKIRIREIMFTGEISVKKEILPLSEIRTYDSLSDGKNIATRASVNFEVDGLSREISFNKIAETGEVHVLLHSKKA
ncbi:MAG: hypothetical protein WAN36_03440 [Calditrichia bacterium]